MRAELLKLCHNVRAPPDRGVAGGRDTPSPQAHLNGVIGSADLLLENSLRQQQREFVTTLWGSAESLHHSLNDVLEYSSIESGQIQITQAPFDLRQPPIDIMEQFSPQTALRGLELVLIVAADVPTRVVGDAARL